MRLRLQCRLEVEYRVPGYPTGILAGVLMKSLSNAVISQSRTMNGAKINELSSPPVLNPFPVDTSPELLRLTNEYNQEAIPVSFRDLVPWIKVGERATHYLHSYPAKLLPQIAHFFLAANVLSRPGDLILDPFGGTGTVALEALLSGRNAIQSDANPLARLIAQVKTICLPAPALTSAFDRVKIHFKKSRANKPPPVVNLQYWYSPEDIRALCRLRAAILNEADKSLRDFLLVTFSSVCRRVSHADPKFSVPVRRKGIPEIESETRSDVWNQFEAQFAANVGRYTNLRRFGFDSNKLTCVGDEARNLRKVGEWDCSAVEPLPAGSVDLIITSPPYAGAQKYVRASSLSLGWLGLAGAGELRSFERKNIGREHLDLAEVNDRTATGLPDADSLITAISEENPRRAAIVRTYLLEMQSALNEAVRVLKPGGSFVLVIGDNQVCGRVFASSRYLTQILNDLGLETKLRLVDKIRSRGLMTKRNKTASIISQEWVILLQKPLSAQ